ncbi:MAG TPA: ferredoxin [Trebonia sp.]|jgi:ferredoxin|nr:ferredoxin [Trebonia sp.]
MKISIDAARCQGHGRCYELAPDLFTDDEWGRGSVITPDVRPEQAGQANTAVNACPERAISIDG